MTFLFLKNRNDEKRALPHFGITITTIDSNEHIQNALPAHSRFGAATVLRNARTALYLHGTSGERIVRGLARPDIGFARTKMAHLLGGQFAERGIGLLDMLEPGW